MAYLAGEPSTIFLVGGIERQYRGYYGIFEAARLAELSESFLPVAITQQDIMKRNRFIQSLTCLLGPTVYMVLVRPCKD